MSSSIKRFISLSLIDSGVTAASPPPGAGASGVSGAPVSKDAGSPNPPKSPIAGSVVSPAGSSPGAGCVPLLPYN